MNNNSKYMYQVIKEESIKNEIYDSSGKALIKHIEDRFGKMPQEVYNQMLFARDGVRHRWESLVNPNLKISDLDEQEIHKTVRLGIESGRLPENTGTFIPDILGRFSLFDKISAASLVSASMSTFSFISTSSRAGSYSSAPIPRLPV